MLNSISMTATIIGYVILYIITQEKFIALLRLDVEQDTQLLLLRRIVLMLLLLTLIHKP